MRRVAFGILGAVLLLLLFTIPTFAMDNPDSISIGDVFVFRNLLETGDQLYFCRYDVAYNSTPSQDPEDTFQMALYNSGGSLVATRPLNFYQENIISIYFTPAQVTSKNLTWQAAHVIRIQGMPTVFSPLVEGSNMTSSTLSPSDFYEDAFLPGIMIAQAEILETDWGTTLLDAYDKLNTTGAAFFLLAVPQLGTIAPEIFEVVQGDTTVDYTTYNDSYATTLEANQGSKLSGAIASISGIFKVQNPEWTGFLLVVMLFLMIAGTISSGLGNAGWGMIVGYSVIAGCGYLFGGNIFMLAIEVGVALFIVFAVYFVLSRFNV